MDCDRYDNIFRLLTYGQDPAAHLLVRLGTFIVVLHSPRHTPKCFQFSRFLEISSTVQRRDAPSKLVAYTPSRGIRELPAVLRESRRNGLNVEEILVEGSGIPSKESWIMRDSQLKNWTEATVVMTDHLD